MKITGWGVFWLFIIIFFVVDTGLFLKGYNTFFWSYRTPEELQDQKKKLGIQEEK